VDEVEVHVVKAQALEGVTGRLHVPESQERGSWFSVASRVIQCRYATGLCMMHHSAVVLHPY
jgi:hypothetical protein